MYVRISIVRPMPQEFMKVSRVLDELTDFLARQDGHTGGVRLESDSGQTRPPPTAARRRRRWRHRGRS